METGRVRILIVDDHEVFRMGLRGFLAYRPEWEVCGEAMDGLDAVAKARELQPDVILMDISLPKAGGLEATRMISSERPSSKVIMLSRHDAPHVISAARESGARAYVTKPRAAQNLLSVMEEVIQGQEFDWSAVDPEAP